MQGTEFNNFCVLKTNPPNSIAIHLLAVELSINQIESIVKHQETMRVAISFNVTYSRETTVQNTCLLE